MQQIYEDKKKQGLQAAGKQPGGDEFPKLAEYSASIPTAGGKYKGLVDDECKEDSNDPGNHIAYNMIEPEQTGAWKVDGIVDRGGSGTPKDVRNQFFILYK